MTELNWPEDGPIMTDAEFKVIRGAYREYEEHPDRPGWRFTGHYDDDGDPLWHNLTVGQKHPKNRRAEFIGLFDEKCRPLYYVRPRFLPEWLRDPITLNRERWEKRTGWARIAAKAFTLAASVGLFYGWSWKTRGRFVCYMLFFWPLLAFTIGLTAFVGAYEGLRVLSHVVGSR